ncbi:MAG: hypothetical protein QOI16_1166 [Pseudonocardiales bacterium]|nr:hypothetical protein [Pseudonocardiales bacterium]
MSPSPAPDLGGPDPQLRRSNATTPTGGSGATSSIPATDEPSRSHPGSHHRRSPGMVAELMSSTHDDTNPDDTAPGDDSALASVTPLHTVRADPSGAPTDLSHEASEHHPTALGRHLDTYLAAVAGELQANGVLTGAPQRSNPAHRLIGSIVLDCTALRRAAWTPEDQISGTRSLGHALQPERPAPVLASWDEDKGWCVGLHHDPTHSSRLYLHPDLLPAPQAVADFVVGLALGQALGTPDPITPAGLARPRLRLLP